MGSIYDIILERDERIEAIGSSFSLPSSHALKVSDLGWRHGKSHSWMHISSKTNATEHDNVKFFFIIPLSQWNRSVIGAINQTVSNMTFQCCSYRLTFHEWKITGNFQSPCQFRLYLIMQQCSEYLLGFS